MTLTVLLGGEDAPEETPRLVDGARGGFLEVPAGLRALPAWSWFFSETKRQFFRLNAGTKKWERMK